MKVAIGHRLLSGPWGGGNQFAVALVEALETRGDTVEFDLSSSDLDLIIMTDPRSRNPAVPFIPRDILHYIRRRNPNALVVHRINECDGRKGTHTMNFRLRLANTASDHTVFIGSWLRDLNVWNQNGASSVILNGADKRIFNADGTQPWNGEEPLRLVTHHWGGHRLKGFDVYEKLDKMLGLAEWRDRLAFTYVGNLPAGFSFVNAEHRAPLDGEKLADELRRHHVYVTASIFEPAGMHHIEGALSGLPLLYRKSGALPEYCDGYGESFSGPDDFTTALTAIMTNYEHWYAAMPNYANTAASMCEAYLGLFDNMMESRSQIIACRRTKRSFLALALNQIPW